MECVRESEWILPHADPWAAFWLFIAVGPVCFLVVPLLNGGYRIGTFR